MRRMVVIVTGILMLMLPMNVAFAQSDGSEVSWFRQFMWAGDFLGLVIIWTLLAMSAFSIGFSVNLMLGYRRKKMMPEETLKKIEVQLGNRQYREAITEADNNPSYLCKIIGAALHEAPNGFVSMERAIEETSDNETVRILRPLEYLNVLGNIAPMVGLFGTVYGMIRAFQELVAAGGNAEPGKLAAGISTALITTFWGLVVAVPALTAYALIRNKVDAYASEAVLVAESLIAPFKPTQVAIQQARMQQAQLQAQIQAQAQAQVLARNQGSGMGPSPVQQAGAVQQEQGQGQQVQSQQPVPQNVQQAPVVEDVQPVNDGSQGEVMAEVEAEPAQGQPNVDTDRAQAGSGAGYSLADAVNDQPSTEHRKMSSPLLSAAASQQQKIQERKQ
ncbi:Biopolymer transport protein ExbB [Poriferisphaera corsica]|uniref:Biopolymer transport protein ExbB n=1 Tax=Poriferisphaera corsica TaxID=2528020 RepID=A0A517YRP5_9BACT|nr:MotA/TolQ/ExbB proton channel family protein [Poriferisphaera corsica]QDU32896.1 Biopolymer transport protein ExbB [Poriferisphaera corsica]